MDTTEVEDLWEETERDECCRATLDTVSTGCNLIVSTIATCDLLFLFTFITGKPLSKLIIDPLLDLCFFFKSDLLFSHSNIGSTEISLPMRLLSSSSWVIWKNSWTTLPISPTTLFNNDLNGKSSCLLCRVCIVRNFRARRTWQDGEWRRSRQSDYSWQSRRPFLDLTCGPSNRRSPWSPQCTAFSWAWALTSHLGWWPWGCPNLPKHHLRVVRWAPWGAHSSLPRLW